MEPRSGLCDVAMLRGGEHLGRRAGHQAVEAVNENLLSEIVFMEHIDKRSEPRTRGFLGSHRVLLESVDEFDHLVVLGGGADAQRRVRGLSII